jgi:hypothetical protein
MPLDPFADRARRAWLDCPNCRHGRECATCQAGRTCAQHWQYLLTNEATLLHLQCPTCTHLWSYDTREAS